jgi:hypothetical protein
MLPNEQQREAILRVTLQRHDSENEIDEELTKNEPDSAGVRPLQVVNADCLHVVQKSGTLHAIADCNDHQSG